MWNDSSSNEQPPHGKEHNPIVMLITLIEQNKRGKRERKRADINRVWNLPSS